MTKEPNKTKIQEKIKEIKKLQPEKRNKLYHEICHDLSKKTHLVRAPYIKQLAKATQQKSAVVEKSVESLINQEAKSESVIRKLAKENNDWKKINESKELQHEANSFDDLRMRAVTQLATRTKEGLRSATEYVKKYLLREENIITIRDKSEEMWMYQDGVYVEYAETYIKSFCSRVFNEAYTDRLAAEVIDKIKAKTYVDMEEFFSSEPKYRICLENGVLDLKDKVLYEHNPDEIHFSRLPIIFDSSLDCPKIKQFFSDVLSNPDEDLLCIQEIFGWFLIKEYKPEKAVMMYGGGRNGKGKTQKIMEAFLGSSNVSAISIHELDPSNNQYAVSALANKLANFGGDVSEGSLRDTSMIRSVTGRDRLEANRKYLSPIKFVNYAKLVFAANKPPMVFDEHEGFWSRWVWLRFPYTFKAKEDYDRLDGDSNPLLKVKDVDIVEKIMSDDELSGLLNWAILGLERLLKNNDFSGQKTMQEIRIEWTRQSNSFEAFCMDCLTDDYTKYVKKSELRRAFSVYCRDNDVKGVGDGLIKSTLAKKFGSTDDSRPQDSSGSRDRCWSGIAFVSEDSSRSDDKFSYSSLGMDFVHGEYHRVLHLMRIYNGDLVPVDDLQSRLPKVDVDSCLAYLDKRGDVFSPKNGFWSVLD